MSKLLVVGASGFLGREVAATAAAAGWDVVGTSFTQPGRRLDVRDANAVELVVEEVQPDAVIQTAYVQEGPAAWATTVTGAANVARATRTKRLVHLSTDVVFDGRRDGAYREEDALSPVSDYGRAKAEAERLVRHEHPGALLVRTSLIVAGRGRDPGKHELAALRGGTFYTDEIRCPIAVSDLAAALLELAVSQVAGPLHVAGADAVSRYELARLVVAAAGGDEHGLRPARAPAGRPLNCALDSSRAQAMINTRLRGVRSLFA